MNAALVRRVLLPLHELALGRATFRYLRELEVSQWWPAQRLRELQREKLRRLLTHAWRTCPFHRRRLDQAGIDPAGATLESLAGLPTMTKADIRRYGEQMIDPTAPGGLHRLTTGGSTGHPLSFVVDRRRQAADQAARARTRRWFGIEVGEREAYLWGSPVELSRQDRLKTVRDALTNHRLFSAFCLTPAIMSRYLDQLRAFDPVHLFGYPSSLARLARHAARTGVRLKNPSLRAVFASGEVFDPADRAIIEEQAGTPVADGYGSREGGFVAHQCPAGAYHQTMESVIVELLDAEGRPAAAGQPGEITLTHLDAYGMPFIRYRTGDMARASRGVCPCGRGLELLEGIEGRRTDMLRTSGGGYAHALSVIYVLRDEPGVTEFKVIQRPNLDLEVRIVPGAGWNEGAGRRIAAGLRRRIGDSIDVRLQLVDRIPPEASGKHRHVISEADQAGSGW